MKSEKKILLKDVNEFITCVLCKGYLIDATTITECLHTFCKKCIVEYLEENTNCPICDTLLHQSHPLLYISHDRTLQSIVYKMVANLEKNEIERQCKFYREKNLEFPAQLKEKLEKNAQFSYLRENNNNKMDEKPIESSSASSSSYSNNNENTAAPSSTASNSSNSNSHPNDYHRNDEQIALSLEPLDGLKNLQRKYILCSCHCTITHLKKYIAMNIYSNLDLYKELDIVCNDEILGKDHTLKFILVTKWKDKEQPMRLNFRPKMIF
jgi:polycomb group RING finger protein 3